MDWTRFLVRSRARKLVGGLVGISLLVLIVLSFNTLFSSRSQKPRQSLNQPSIPPFQTLHPTPSTRSDKMGPATRWNTYTTQEYDFSLEYPSSLGIDETETGVVIGRGDLGSPTPPSFYIQVISKDSPEGSQQDPFLRNLTKYLSVEVGDTISPPNQPWDATFTRLPDEIVDGRQAVVFEGKAYGPSASEDSTKDRRMIIESKESYYIIGTYYDFVGLERNWKQFTAILDTLALSP